jgi:ABC-type branched-subunit amino acid transport system substrate-binding protein
LDVKIAALLPLVRSGPPSASKEVAEDVYDGIVYALERYGPGGDGQVKVTLETRDTERNPDLAGRFARDLASDRRVIAIIGPIFSNTTSAAAAVAQTEGVTLVSPTANANGIAATGQYVFQANPDYTTRGRAMARYAILEKGFRTVATLAPQDTYGRLLAEAFCREAEDLGAKVVGREWYAKGTTDLKEQLTSLRRAAMMENADPMVSFAKVKTTEVMKLLDRGVPKKRIDSLMSAGAMIKATDLLGPNGRMALDSMGIPPVYDLTMLDSLQFPATGIQALYLPIRNADEVGVVAAQTVYYNLQTQMLGSGEWNDITELSEHRRYCTGLVFDADTYVDTAGDLYREFAAGFAARFKKSPSQNALFGYDTAELILLQIRNGAASRPALARALSQVKDYQGLHSRIGFGQNRVNSWLSIMQFDGKSVKKIDEIGME